MKLSRATPVGVTAALLGLATACTSAGTTPQETAAAPEFAGLPPAVVVEVLSNPKAQANIQPGLSEKATADMWQGMAVNFIFCRQMLSYYEDWRDSGVRPKSFPRPPRVANPRESFTDMVGGYRYYHDEAKAGEIAKFRSLLTNDSGCGVWIPAKPGDVTGSTIADVVNREG